MNVVPRAAPPDVLLLEVDGMRTRARLHPGEVLLIGRDPSCQVVIANREVSRRHAEIGRVQDGWVIRDLSSRNGTYLDGDPIDTIEFPDRVEVRLVSPHDGPLLRLTVPAGSARDETTVTTIGRGAACDIMLVDSQVSRRHAELRHIDGEFQLVDLDSNNGTHHNGSRIDQAVTLHADDRVTIGPFELVFDGQRLHRPVEPASTPADTEQVFGTIDVHRVEKAASAPQEPGSREPDRAAAVAPDDHSVSPDTDQVRWRRLDPRMVLADAVMSALSLTPTVLAVLVFGVEPTARTTWPILIIAVFGVTGAAGNTLRWIKTRYRITSEHVERRTGLIFRKYRSIRRDRIRSVETTAKLRHRLTRLRMVSIGAGQMNTAFEKALSLDAVSRETAVYLRQDLMDGRLEADSDSEDHSAEQVIARLRGSWVFYNMFNIWAYLGAAIALWIGYWTAITFGLDPVELVTGLVDWQRLGWVWSTIIGLAAAGAVGVCVLALTFFLENWRLRLTRVPSADDEGTTLRTTRGLLKAREVNRDERRIRGGKIDEPLFWRWIGSSEPHVITTGLAIWSLDPASAILPRSPISVTRPVLATVLGEHPSPLDAPLRPHPGGALRRRTVWALVASAAIAATLAWLAATIGPFPSWAPLAGLALIPVALAAAVLAYRALGHTLAGDYLVFRSGLLTRTTAALQSRAVAGWYLRQSVLQRRLGLLSVAATTPAGEGDYGAPDLDYQEALRFVEAAVPAMLAPFLESTEAGSAAGEKESHSEPVRPP